MLKFNQIPPTAETTDVDPSAIRFLAHGIEDRCMNNVAEACASLVMANTTDMEDVAAIGEKIGREIRVSPHTKYPHDDSSAFLSRYTRVVSVMSGDFQAR